MSLMNKGVRSEMVPSLSVKAPARSLAHDRLRSSTRDLHVLVDDGFDLTSISNAPGYLAFLLSNWPFASIEAALETAEVHRLLPEWDNRRRREGLATLRADARLLNFARLDAEPGAPLLVSC
jgi:heme oxygenase